MKNILSLSIALLAISACTSLEDPSRNLTEPSSDHAAKSATSSEREGTMMEVKSESTAEKTDEDWKRILSPKQYEILREAGTERPFTSPLLNEHRKGTYVTADCDEPVFRSEQKFDSGTGWPSFWAPISADAIVEKTDTTFGMQRTEVLSRCGGHLGHVFNDGPEPTGLCYCMNGLALKFVPDEDQK